MQSRRRVVQQRGGTDALITGSTLVLTLIKKIIIIIMLNIKARRLKYYGTQLHKQMIPRSFYASLFQTEEEKKSTETGAGEGTS